MSSFGLLDNIKEFLIDNQIKFNIDKDFEEYWNNGIENAKIYNFSIPYREHQEKSIEKEIKANKKKKRSTIY